LTKTNENSSGTKANSVEGRTDGADEVMLTQLGGNAHMASFTVIAPPFSITENWLDIQQIQTFMCYRGLFECKHWFSIKVISWDSNKNYNLTTTSSACLLKPVQAVSRIVFISGQQILLARVTVVVFVTLQSASVLQVPVIVLAAAIKFGQ
jgi:hypothetical protein